MQEKRFQHRMLCADLVNVHWTDEDGHTRRAVANLEDISLSGACLQLDEPIHLHASLRILTPNGALVGSVRYCVYREIGYFIGVQFNAGSTWSRKTFKPQHLFDPRRLMTDSGPHEDGFDLESESQTIH
jgi:hypothetical protein